MASGAGFFPTSPFPARAPAALPRVGSFPVRARLSEDNESAAVAEEGGSSEEDEEYGSEAESFLSRSEFGGSSYEAGSGGEDAVGMDADEEGTLSRVASMPRARLSREDEEEGSAGEEEGSYVESVGEDSVGEDDGGFVSSARVVVGGEGVGEEDNLSSVAGGLEDSVEEFDDELAPGENVAAVSDREASDFVEAREESREVQLLETSTVISTSAGREESLEAYMAETSDAGSTTSGDSTDCTDIYDAVVGDMVEEVETNSPPKETSQTTQQHLLTKEEDGFSGHVSSDETVHHPSMVDADHTEFTAEGSDGIELRSKKVSDIADSSCSFDMTAALSKNISSCAAPQTTISNAVAHVDDSVCPELYDEMVIDPMVDIVPVEIDEIGNGISPGSGSCKSESSDADGNISEAENTTTPFEFEHMQESVSIASTFGRSQTENDTIEAHQIDAEETVSTVHDQDESLDDVTPANSAFKNENDLLLQGDGRSENEDVRCCGPLSETRCEFLLENSSLVLDRNELEILDTKNHDTNVRSSNFSEASNKPMPATEASQATSCQPDDCATEVQGAELLASEFFGSINGQKSETAEELPNALEEASLALKFESGTSGDSSEPISDNSFLGYGEEEKHRDYEKNGENLFSSNAITALLRAMRGNSSDGSDTYDVFLDGDNSCVNPNCTDDSEEAELHGSSEITDSCSKSFSLHPAIVEVPTATNPTVVECEYNLNEEDRKLLENFDRIQVKFLRLVRRAGCSLEDTMALEVLHRLSLAEGIKSGRPIYQALNIDLAKKKALQLEENGDNDLDFSCNILVLGKCGVGKSATINSIFGKSMTATSAFAPGTTHVGQFAAVIEGIRIRVIDTPGLKLSSMDHSCNMKMLSSIRKFIKKYPPDIVLYINRLDIPSRVADDVPLLRSVSDMLGSNIWSNTIIVLSHAASVADDDDLARTLSSYDMYAAQRSLVIQQSIRQAARNFSLVNPISLVENHHSCKANSEGQKVLPDGRVWKSHLLLLCYSCKILSDANPTLKSNGRSPGKSFGFRLPSFPLRHLLSTVLQSRQPPSQDFTPWSADGYADLDLNNSSTIDRGEEHDGYDELSTFKLLNKSEVALLSKVQRKAYYEEYNYHVKRLWETQMRLDIKRLQKMMNRRKRARRYSSYDAEVNDYNQDAASVTVTVPFPDIAVPQSFACNNPENQYRFLGPILQLSVRPLLGYHGWDHDFGYDGIRLEEKFALCGNVPAGVKIAKDKKVMDIQLNSSISADLGETGKCIAAFDIRMLGKNLAYVLTNETTFHNFKKNKTVVGISAFFLEDGMVSGFKIEDQFFLSKRISVSAGSGVVRSHSQMAYGAKVEMQLKERDCLIDQKVSTLGVCLTGSRGDYLLGANIQSQISLGRNTKMSLGVRMNNKLSGQVTVRTNTLQQLEIAIFSVLAVVVPVFQSFWC